ncbi:MAG TPA: Sir2 family NAD-dependent protein deacetylase, partial [Thermoanaerobaculia bacterium]
MEVLKAAIEAIRKAKPRKIVVLTGAGVSADSGIPTFRGEGGLWRNFRAEDLATPEAFASNPLLVWEWYEWRRSIVRNAEPNAAHRAIASL